MLFIGGFLNPRSSHDARRLNVVCYESYEDLTWLSRHLDALAKEPERRRTGSEVQRRISGFCPYQMESGSYLII